MYQALYRKWRPKTFSDVVGQHNITATLLNEVESGSTSHAYLFTGSRGTGKTTCAKILAKAVNCLHPVNGNPCNECEICKGIDSGSVTDVVEIDAASNNGVDNIRAVIEETNFTPVKAKKRVYIIDEVHMLSTAACNAFLKTLEEPLAHVIFILATTDPQKLLPTVRSRCQRFDFKRIYPEDIAGRLSFIAGQEGLTLAADAAALIARIADGALRDALSLLDVCSVKSKDISLQVVSEVAGLADKFYLFALTDCIKNGDSGKALEIIQDLHNNSCEMELLCSEMMNHFRSLMIIKTVKSGKKAAELLVCTDVDFEKFRQQADLFDLEDIISALLLLEETAGNINKGVNKRVEMEITLIRLCSGRLSPAAEIPEEKPFAGPPQRPPEREIAAEQEFSPSFLKEDSSSAVNEYAPAAQVSPAAVPEPETAKAFAENASPAAEHTEIESDTRPVSCGPAGKPAINSFPAAENALSSEKPAETDEIPFSCWKDVLDEVFNQDRPLWGWISDTKAFVREDILTICVKDKSALKTFLGAGNHIERLSACVSSVSGKSYKIDFSEKKSSASTPSSAGNDKLNSFFNKINGLNL